jgi:hypothetical protein
MAYPKRTVEGRAVDGRVVVERAPVDRAPVAVTRTPSHPPTEPGGPPGAPKAAHLVHDDAACRLLTQIAGQQIDQMRAMEGLRRTMARSVGRGVFYGVLLVVLVVLVFAWAVWFAWRIQP